MPVPAVTVASLGDLQNVTLPELNRLRIVDLTTDLQNFTVWEFMKKGSTITVSSGKNFQWTCMVNGSGTAQNVGLGYQDRTSIVDTTVLATAEWRHTKVDWAMIGQEEQFNADPAKIVDIEMLREKASMISQVELMEQNLWGPPVAITDTITPWGIKTWFVKNASEGFNGGAPSGYTTIGLNPTTYPRWKNYTFQYTTVDDTDFVRKLNRAIEFTNWKPPVEGMPLLAQGNKYMMYSNYGLIGPLQELLKASNDNLGMDISKYLGAVMINRMPLVRVPALEVDTTNPIYGIATDDFKIYRLKNWWMKKTELDKVPGHHTIKARYLDTTMQHVAVNRRRTFVGATGTTEPS